MDNGTISIYDPSSIINTYESNQTGTSSNDALLTTIDRQKHGAISAMKFNPHASSPCLLATGSSLGELLISSLDNPLKPTVASPSKDYIGSSLNSNVSGTTASAVITSLAWNTEVPHIIASGNGNGMVTIWDLRENKPWCELRCEISGSAVSCVQWNPSQGMHLITSSADDRNPVIKLWDLRASMTMPFASTEGMPGSHEKGILDIDWCPFDESLLVSCGKDNKTLLWDLVLFRPICEIPNDSEDNIDGDGLQQQGIGEMQVHPTLSGIGGGFNTSQQKRYNVKWSPIRRGVLSTCSFDRKVQAHSVLGVATKLGRPPKWMKPESGVSFGFGGSITSFASIHKHVTMAQFVEKTNLEAAVEQFELSIASGDYVSFSIKKQEAATNLGDAFEAKVWGFMQVIFDPNARAKLLFLLGFDPEKIQHTASDFIEEKKTDPSNSKSISLPMSGEAEKAVHEALLVGNFEAAVDCCMRSGNLADALILASCGGAELWAKTQAQYFENEQQKRPFLSIVSAVIHNKVSCDITFVAMNLSSAYFNAYDEVYVSLRTLSYLRIQLNGTRLLQPFVLMVHKRNSPYFAKPWVTDLKPLVTYHMHPYVTCAHII